MRRTFGLSFFVLGIFLAMNTFAKPVENNKRNAKTVKTVAKKAAPSPSSNTESHILCGGSAKVCITWWRMAQSGAVAQWKSKTINSMSVGTMDLSSSQYIEEVGALRKIAVTPKPKVKRKTAQSCTGQIYIAWGTKISREACLNEFSARDQARLRRLLL